MPDSNSLPSALQSLREQGAAFEQELAKRNEERRRQTAASREAANLLGRFLEARLRMDEAAGAALWREGTFVPKEHAEKLVPAFVAACAVLHERGFLAALDTIDAEQMVAVYGKDRCPELAPAAYATAEEILRAGVASKGREPPKKHLAETVETLAGRQAWYFVAVLIRAVALQEIRRFERQVKRRPCYERDHTFWQWSQAGQTPAQIRDRWNRENPGSKIGVGNSGRATVVTGIKTAKKEQSS